MAKSRPAKASRRVKAVKSTPSPADNSAGAMLSGVDLVELRRLIRLVQRTGIGELEVSSGGRSVRISAPAGGPVAVTAPAAAPGGGAAAGASLGPSKSGGAANEPAETYPAIVSPMVGTFYRAPAPDADPYVEVGDVVEVGQTVCIVEAMKLMNEIESEIKGRIVQIMAENAQAVEFGQPLFRVEPL